MFDQVAQEFRQPALSSLTPEWVLRIDINQQKTNQQLPLNMPDIFTLMEAKSLQVTYMKTKRQGRSKQLPSLGHAKEALAFKNTFETSFAGQTHSSMFLARINN